MNTKKYNLILYIITATVAVTLAVQFYWNFINYQENKRQVNNELQISLDNAVESYYSELSKKNFFSISTQKNGENLNLFKDFWLKDSSDINHRNLKITSLKITTDDPDEYKKLPKLLDSVFIQDDLVFKSIHEKQLKSPVKLFRGKRKTDSINLVKGVKSVFVALTNNSINFNELDSVFQKQLEQKKIKTNYYFNYYLNDTLKTSSNSDSTTIFQNKIKAKSTYLRSNQKLLLLHDETSLNALKKSFTGIFISLLLSLLIISTLFYLLKIINKQKELAEIKNDLISNITHEFKTPIATVSTAIEAIDNFNAINDKEKTKKYLSMSSGQLKKLNQMVEKLLETATLDSENLMLKKEEIDIVSFTENIVQKHQLIGTYKDINFSSNSKTINLQIDAFHIENAISNLVDNAVKYGGDQIDVNINKLLNQVQIIVADNGNGIEKNQQTKVFDKFYRVPKGNTHDVKGFGIGLYYTKKIIEKHEGSMSLTSNKKQTIFTVNLPYES